MGTEIFHLGQGIEGEGEEEEIFLGLQILNFSDVVILNIYSRERWRKNVAKCKTDDGKMKGVYLPILPVDRVPSRKRLLSCPTHPSPRSLGVRYACLVEYQPLIEPTPQHW